MKQMNQSSRKALLSILGLVLSVSCKADVFRGTVMIPISIPEDTPPVQLMVAHQNPYTLRFSDKMTEQYARTLNGEFVQVDGTLAVDGGIDIPEYQVIDVANIKLAPHTASFCESAEGTYAAIVYPGKAIILKDQQFHTSLACDQAFPTTHCRETSIADAGYHLTLGELWRSGKLYQIWLGGEKFVADLACR